jgi:hypothetical protein
MFAYNTGAKGACEEGIKKKKTVITPPQEASGNKLNTGIFPDYLKSSG